MTIHLQLFFSPETRMVMVVILMANTMGVAQKFDASRTPSVQFSDQHIMDEDQEHPAVSSIDDDHIIVAWHTNDEDAGKSGRLMRKSFQVMEFQNTMKSLLIPIPPDLSTNQTRQ